MSEGKSRKGSFWRGLVSHKPLKKHIEWWLRLCAISAVPLIIVCTIVVSVELAAPGLFKDGLGATIALVDEILLNTAIEGSMLGCIALSKQARREGNEDYANKMSKIGWLFAILTMFTIGFHVFNVDELSSKILLIVRCGSAIVYCYLAHMGQDDEEEIESRVTRVQQQNIESTLKGFTETLAEIESRLSTLKAETEGQIERAFQSIEGNLQFQFQSFSEGLKTEIEGQQTERTESQDTERRLFQYLDQRLSVMAETTESALKNVETRLSEMHVKAEQKPAQPVSPPQVKERSAKPSVSVKAEGVSERESFVFQCLEEDPEMSLTEIQRRATERGLSISVGSASTYRKNFKDKLKLKARLKIVGE